MWHRQILRDMTNGDQVIYNDHDTVFAIDIDYDFNRAPPNNVPVAPAIHEPQPRNQQDKRKYGRHRRRRWRHNIQQFVRVLLVNDSLRLLRNRSWQSLSILR